MLGVRVPKDCSVSLDLKVGVASGRESDDRLQDVSCIPARSKPNMILPIIGFIFKGIFIMWKDYSKSRVIGSGYYPIIIYIIKPQKY